MASMLSSQAVVLATAMVISSTVLFLAVSKQFSGNQGSHHDDVSPKHPPRSCLNSEEKKKKKSKKKRVQFAESVKDTQGNGEKYRKEQGKKTETPRKFDRICRNEMPANRVALYNGILRDRVHRVECSY